MDEACCKACMDSEAYCEEWHPAVRFVNPVPHSSAAAVQIWLLWADNVRIPYTSACCQVCARHLTTLHSLLQCCFARSVGLCCLQPRVNHTDVVNWNLSCTAARVSLLRPILAQVAQPGCQMLRIRDDGIR